MKRSLCGFWLLAATLLFGCHPTAPSAPELTGISPDRISKGEQVEATLSGRGLHARIRTDLDRQAATAQLPAVVFVRDDERFNAEVLELVSEQSLTIRTPASLTPGAWDLELKDPWGQRAELKGAFTVSDCGADTDCDDGVPCTEDTCVEGVCTHPPASDRCLIDGECLPAGAAAQDDACQVCNPAVSQTAFSPAEEGTSCDDGDLCTEEDVCHSGACGGTLKTCAVGTCERAVCEPSSGECVVSPAEDASPCDDGAACTTDDHCEAGECVGQSVCANTPPRACLHVSPLGAVIGGMVRFDASCSSDLESRRSELEYRFDFDGDGSWDTSFSSMPTVDHSYPAAGLYVPALEVRDPGALSGYAQGLVSVADPTSDVVVTTEADEDDANASPSSPGGTGLSLREAIKFVNSNPAGQRIRFQPGLEITSGSVLTLSAENVTIVGEPDVEITFTGTTATSTCLTLEGAGDALIGVNARGCEGQLIDLKQPNQSVRGGRFEGSSASACGIRIKEQTQTVGPGTELSGFGDNAIETKASDGVIDGVRIHDCGTGIRVMVTGGNARIDRSVIYANTLGLDLRATTAIRACVIAGNTSDGIKATGSQSLAVRSSLLTGNGGFGINATSQTIASRDTNGYFGNGGGPLSGGQLPAANDVTADPLYLAPQAGDYRLGPESPAINAGVDLGLDLNGAAPNRFNGPLPDLGAEESPW